MTRTHGNSKAAFQALGPARGERHVRILEIVGRLGAATDRQILEELLRTEPELARRGQDPNLVRPRITELVQGGALREDPAPVECPVTGFRVRQVRLATAVQGVLW